MTTPQRTITLIIPAHNEEVLVADTVRAALTIPGVEQLIVVDDGSDDETAAVASAAGAAVPADMQGASVLPLMTGDPAVEWRKSIYYHYYEHPAVHNVAKHYGVRTARHKLIYYYETEEWELFDLDKDPHEMNSLYGDPAYAEITAELKKELKRLREQYGDDTGKAF